jgi:hypothetical protein
VAAEAEVVAGIEVAIIVAKMDSESIFNAYSHKKGYNSLF